MLLHSAVKLPNKVIFSIKDGFLSRKILNSLSELSKVLIILGRLNVDITLVCVCVCVCARVRAHEWACTWDLLLHQKIQKTIMLLCRRLDEKRLC